MFLCSSPPVILSHCPFLHTSTADESTLLHSSNMVLYTCYCLKTSIQPLQAMTSLYPTLWQCKRLSLSSELLITALLTLAGLNHVAKRLQFLKRWLRRLLWWENLPYGAQHFLESIYNYYVQCWWHKFYSSSQCSMFASVHPLALKY